MLFRGEKKLALKLGEIHRHVGSSGKKEGNRALEEGQEGWPELIALVPKQEDEDGHLGSNTFVPWKWDAFFILSPLIPLSGAPVLMFLSHPVWGCFWFIFLSTWHSLFMFIDPVIGNKKEKIQLLNMIERMPFPKNSH